MTVKTDKVTQRELEVIPPGRIAQLKWKLMRGLLSTVGKTSAGVSLGYRYGFDSGSMLDYVYVNKAHGSFLIGKLIDRMYLNAIGWRGIRARRVLLKQVLKAEIGRNRAQGQPIRLLDVAAGPGRYLQELLLEVEPERGDVQILCRDLSPDGLAQGAAQAKAAGLASIHYEVGDAFNPASTQEKLGGAPNIIVVSGLYELLLEDATIQNSLARLYQLLAPGGAIFFTTQTHHPQLEFIANVLPNRDGQPWIMKCRSVEQVEGWAREVGFSQVVSGLETVGLFAVTSARK